MPSGFSIHRMALAVIESDRGAQRPVYKLGVIAAHGWKLFGPPIMESVGSALIQSMSEAPCVLKNSGR